MHPTMQPGGCLEVQIDFDRVNILAVILWNIEITADDMAVVMI